MPNDHSSDAASVAVSVLMSTRDRLDLLPGALASVLAQTVADWELVLVADGGPSPADVVRSLGDGRIRLLEGGGPRGKGAAVNRAFAASRGARIAHLDDDDAWRPGHLAALLAGLDATPGARMAFSDAERVELTPDGRGGWRETGRSLPYSGPTTLAELIEYNRITGISVVHDRALFEEAGGMDEELEVLLDWDLWRRMAALTRPLYVDAVTADYFVRLEPEDAQGVEAPAIETAPGAHITGLARRDPVRYVENRLRILDKDIPLPPDGSLDAALAKARARGRMQLAVALGEREQAAGNADTAKGHYEAARAAAPRDVLPLRKLGLMAQAAGEHEDALRLFGQAFSLPGGLPLDALHAAGAAMALGAPDRALRVLEAATGRFGPGDEGHEAATRLLARVRALAR